MVMEVKISSLVDDKYCYEAIRGMRWPDGVKCPHCCSCCIIKHGVDDRQSHRQRYECKSCCKRFDDLTNTVFSGHHQPLKTWIICLYFMGLNLSNAQISQELGLKNSDTHEMTSILRRETIERKPSVVLSGEVECDEVYVVAGHKGNLEAVKKKIVKVGEIACEVLLVVEPWKRRSRQYLDSSKGVVKLLYMCWRM